MDWRLGPSHRALALQAGSPEFITPDHHKKRKRNKRKGGREELPHLLGEDSTLYFSEKMKFCH
jgi:hypothetical protein